MSVYLRMYTLNCAQKVTCDSHAVGPLQRIPDHRPVCDWKQSLWYLLGRRCECAEGSSRSTEYDGLEPRRRKYCVRHCGCGNRPCGLETFKTSKLQVRALWGGCGKSHPAEIKWHDSVATAEAAAHGRGFPAPNIREQQHHQLFGRASVPPPPHLTIS
jgi:hypothetical protein